MIEDAHLYCIEEINAYYEVEKAKAEARGCPQLVTYRIVERRFNLKAGTLGNWRANRNLRRAHNGVGH